MKPLPFAVALLLTRGCHAPPPVAPAQAAGAPPSHPPWCLSIAEHPQGVDWARALIDSRTRANATFGWGYTDGLYLHGVYLAYKRTGEPGYFSLVQTWGDAHLNRTLYRSLDEMQPTLVLDDLFRETGDPKYSAAPKAMAARLATDYPKTADGGFWHNQAFTDQLWGDGVFMDLPPLVSYGELAGDESALDTAAQQLLIYDQHLATPDNLHAHEWDGAIGQQVGQVWCRAEGWYEMALAMVLDVTPPSHENYLALVEIAQRLAAGLASTQDPATGRWWQVMNTGDEAGNWLETSCTEMHSYFLSLASEKGWIDAATYAPLAVAGFRGVMAMVSDPSDVKIAGICPSSDPRPLADYYAQVPVTNDAHGLGAFLVMYDQLTCR